MRPNTISEVIFGIKMGVPKKVGLQSIENGVPFFGLK
jgi:hypothetical protein